MNRRTFLKSTAATSLLAVGHPTSGADSGSAGSDADLLAEARERIEKHRKADGAIVVRDTKGKAVPGATVKIEQMRHEFLFGSNFFMFDRVRDAELEEQYRQRFASLLNYATLGFYWGAYEPERGKPNYPYSENAAAWCREKGITVKGHPLVWDHPASSPSWLPEDFAEIQRLSTGRVREIVERFQGKIDMWDVVNEPTDLTRFKNTMNNWAVSLGAVPFTKLHFKVARAAGPKATLLVNDYRTDPAFYQICDALREDGKLMFDAVGIQSHMHDGGWPLRRTWDVCDRYAKLAVPVHFTETTIVSGKRKGPGENWHPTDAEGEARQAEYVPKFYTMLFAHPAVEALTWWDFSDRGAWQRAAAGWLRSDMTPKPVYEQLQALIKRDWWTKTEGRTNDRGEFATRAFRGTHRITVQLAGGRKIEKEVAWRRGQPNRVEMVVD